MRGLREGKEDEMSCPQNWYTEDELKLWMDREGWPVYPTDVVRAKLPKFLAEHFQKALGKGWQLATTSHEAEIQRLIAANEGWHTRVRQLKIDVEALMEKLSAAQEQVT